MKREEIEITAKLAQMELTEEEKVTLATELSRTLEYFKKMGEIDVDNLVPTIHTMIKENRLRTDAQKECIVDPELLVEAAPEEDDDFIIIPNVL